MKIHFTILYLLFATTLLAQKFELNGQLPIWTTLNPEEPVQFQSGVRYLPKLTYSKSFQNKKTFEFEGTVNSYFSVVLYDDTLKFSEKLKPYRLWFKYASDQYEIRAGLQKINFGSANILRPLMWFDQIDPRDPLQLTDGVYGLLGRYYFLNNANIWIWGLIGNKNPKGWEIMPSVKNKPEFGGRIQWPFLTGEMAITYHNRKAKISGTPYENLSNKSLFSENRYAFDVRLDNIVGLWFEGALYHQNHDIPGMKYNKVFNLGVDYTFSLGNGLGLMSEFIRFDISDKLNQPGTSLTMLATTLNYSVSIINNVSAIVYYDISNKSLYRFLNVGWTFDKWNFYAITFWNPDKFQIYSNLGEVSLYAGYGFQFMVVFNH